MDKNIERTIKLIQFLYSYNKFVSAEELAGFIGLSSKTIKLELENISEYLKANDFGLYVTKQNSNYYLERNPIHYLGSLIFNLNQKSTYFFMTVHLFYNEFNLKKTFNNNYYSDSYYYKSKTNYEKKIQKFGLNLSNSPTHLIGDEQFIRFYFYSFYWKNYDKIEWPFTHLKKEQAIEIIQKIEQSIQIYFTETEQLKLAYWIAIIVNRIRNQNYLSHKWTSINLNHVDEKSKTDSDWMKFIFVKQIKADGHIWKEERDFFLSIILLILDAENWGKLISKKKIIYQSGDMLDFSIQFCKNSEKFFRLKKGVNWKTIIYAAYRIVYHQLVLNRKFDAYIITYKRDLLSVPLFNKVYQKFIMEWMDSTNELWDSYQKKPEIYEELKYIVLNSIDIKTYQPSLNTYLYLTKGELEELIVMEHLSKLNYNWIFQKNINDSVDLIITDSLLEKESYPELYFFWNDTSIENNLISLKCFLEK
ncbi:helix-turn-helix domain-containing protein [Carnobacterium maltaromaticum]|uniref:Helix-turn-helix domain-containing protein n=1 Tax=Carnobacterium maltaromaticum TaxID=2751 RepID=A0AAW9KB62_CARML|nr:helix-turn-helix domain-containing protein [Carnobacterium maltaromaticum]MDZ5760712.1 helix-turn-helix domain-containing protein [Carnobacterium maltaromaticum]